jgi:hypothetical protein
LVLLLAVAKMFWKFANEHLLGSELVIASALLLAFLLGVAGAFAEGIFRHALSVAVLIIFVWETLQHQRAVLTSDLRRCWSACISPPRLLPA